MENGLAWVLIILSIVVVIILIIAVVFSSNKTTKQNKYYVVYVAPTDAYNQILSKGVPELFDIRVSTFNNTVSTKINHNQAEVTNLLNSYSNVDPSRIMLIGGSSTTFTMELYAWAQSAKPGVWVASTGMTTGTLQQDYPYLIRLEPDNSNAVAAVVHAMVAYANSTNIQPMIIQSDVTDMYIDYYRDAFLAWIATQNTAWNVPVISVSEWLAGSYPIGYDSILILASSSEINSLYPTLPSDIPMFGTNINVDFILSGTPDITKHLYVIMNKFNAYTSKTKDTWKTLNNYGLNEDIYPISQQAYFADNFLDQSLRNIIDNSQQLGWSSFEERFSASDAPRSLISGWYRKISAAPYLGSYGIVAVVDSMTQAEIAQFRMSCQGSAITLSSSKNLKFTGGRTQTNGEALNYLSVQTFNNDYLLGSYITSSISDEEMINVGPNSNIGIYKSISSIDYSIQNSKLYVASDATKLEYIQTYPIFSVDRMYQ